MSGVFEGVKGLIFSKPEVYNNKNSNLEYIDIIKEVLGKRDYPIIYNFDSNLTTGNIETWLDKTLLSKGKMKDGLPHGEMKVFNEKGDVWLTKNHYKSFEKQ